jgi:hypothetical protein
MNARPFHPPTLRRADPAGPAAPMKGRMSASAPLRGLIVLPPWIDRIVRRDKDWELPRRRCRQAFNLGELAEPAELLASPPPPAASHVWVISMWPVGVRCGYTDAPSHADPLLLGISSRDPMAAGCRAAADLATVPARGSALPRLANLDSHCPLSRCDARPADRCDPRKQLSTRSAPVFGVGLGNRRFRAAQPHDSKGATVHARAGRGGVRSARLLGLRVQPARQ